MSLELFFATAVLLCSANAQLFGGRASAPPTYLLYTRANRNNPVRLRSGDGAASVSRSPYNPTRGTKMLIFGYLDNPSIGQWMQVMKNRWLDSDDLNVLIVDWSGSNGGLYPAAVANARPVGQSVAGFIRAQLCNGGLGGSGCNLGRFHLLGHSLGAHVASFAGKAMNGAIGQITGLDPAGPGFETNPPSARLAPSDAQFVDVLHTDSGGLGIRRPVGTVDIYVNGGDQQPGCGRRAVSGFTGGFVAGARNLVCDHLRAVDYYSEAISRGSGNRLSLAYQCDSYQSFLARRCTTCGPYGGRCVPLGPAAIRYRFLPNVANRPINGQQQQRFFITTAASEPYLRS